MAPSHNNAKAESFFKTLKAEEVYLQDCQSRNETKDCLDHFIHFISDVYNHKRVHSALGYLLPTEFEQLLSTKHTD